MTEERETEWKGVKKRLWQKHLARTAQYLQNYSSLLTRSVWKARRVFLMYIKHSKSWSETSKLFFFSETGYEFNYAETELVCAQLLLLKALQILPKKMVPLQ